MGSLKDEFAVLKAMDAGDQLVKRQRGYDFEKLLNRILTDEELAPRTRFRPDGEEIDGSFLMDGRTFLLEAKWYSTPLPASSVYAFRGKVDGKLSGTLGVFVSMSGYSEEAVDALSLGKLLNIVLFDYEDISAVCAGQATFKAIFGEKLRIAAEEGNVYLTRRVAAQLNANPADPPGDHEVILICEGNSDLAFLEEVVGRLHPNSKANFVSAGGKAATAILCNTLAHSQGLQTARFIIVVDSDGDISDTREMIRNRVEQLGQVRIVAADPVLESWAFTGIVDKTKWGRLAGDYRVRGQKVDLSRLGAEQPSFAELQDALRWAFSEAK